MRGPRGSRAEDGVGRSPPARRRSRIRRRSVLRPRLPLPGRIRSAPGRITAQPVAPLRRYALTHGARQRSFSRFRSRPAARVATTARSIPPPRFRRTTNSSNGVQRFASVKKPSNTTSCAEDDAVRCSDPICCSSLLAPGLLAWRPIRTTERIGSGTQGRRSSVLLKHIATLNVHWPSTSSASQVESPSTHATRGGGITS